MLQTHVFMFVTHRCVQILNLCMLVLSLCMLVLKVFKANSEPLHARIEHRFGRIYEFVLKNLSFCI